MRIADNDGVPGPVVDGIGLALHSPADPVHRRGRKQRLKAAGDPRGGQGPRPQRTSRVGGGSNGPASVGDTGRR